MVACPDSARVLAHRACSRGGWLVIVVAFYLHAFLSRRRSIKTASGGQALLAERLNTFSCCGVRAGTVLAKKGRAELSLQRGNKKGITDERQPSVVSSPSSQPEPGADSLTFEAPSANANHLA